MQQLIDKAFRIAQRAYYWSFGAIAIAGICGYLLSRLVQCDRALGLAIALQSVVYMVLLISLPAILWWFHRQVEKFKLINPTTERTKQYSRLVYLRFLVIDFNVVLNILLFFLFADKSFFMCASIAAVMLLFCRPSLQSVTNELGFAEEAVEEDDE